VQSPLLAYRGIRLRDSAMSKVKHWALKSPRPDDQSTLTLSSSVGTFLIMISLLAISNHSIYRLPNPNAPKLRCAHGLTFQRSHRLVEISNFVGSRILISMDSGLSFPQSPIWYATYPPLTPVVAPHTFSRRDIADCNITILVATTWSFDL
jgi:hypothetical protein